MYDYIIVGCGFSGAVLAERLANEQNKILIIDKRNHIAGNMYDYYDHNGVLVHHYGPHLFHTNHKEVYEYCNDCGACIRRCPADAITKDGKDHAPCDNFLDAIRTKFAPRYGCGKCQTAVPCETKIPKKLKK